MADVPDEGHELVVVRLGRVHVRHAQAEVIDPHSQAPYNVVTRPPSASWPVRASARYAPMINADLDLLGRPLRANERSRANSRGALINAAFEEFSSKGYEAATVAGIAERAGVTTGALYAHFTGKLDLLLATVGLTPTEDVVDSIAGLGRVVVERSIADHEPRPGDATRPGARSCCSTSSSSHDATRTSRTFFAVDSSRTSTR